jgi:outer membrane protein assembly factor BamB
MIKFFKCKSAAIMHLAVMFFVVTIIFDASSQTAAQWRGVNRDGIYNEQNLLESWPAEGPKLLLTIKDLGVGHSSPTITSDRIYVTGLFEKTGYLFSYDLNGTLIWKTSYGPEWSNGYPGVRGTPTIDGNRIYLESGMGQVLCFDTKNGKILWKVDMVKVFEAESPTDSPEYGYSESILIHGDMLICTPSGKKASVAALNKTNGKTLWKTMVEGEISGYCSPAMFKHNNKDLLVTMLTKSVIGINPSDGKLLWKQAHETQFGVNVNTPIYDKGNILYFSGYGQGAGMVKLSDDGASVEVVWQNKKFDNLMGGAVLLGDNLYGSGHQYKNLYCIDVKTGEIKYTSDDFRPGCIISDGKMLYFYGENGKVALVKPETDKFVVTGSFSVKQGKGPDWAHPVIAAGKMYIRHGEVILVYALT